MVFTESKEKKNITDEALLVVVVQNSSYLIIESQCYFTESTVVALVARQYLTHL